MCFKALDVEGTRSDGAKNDPFRSSFFDFFSCRSDPDPEAPIDWVWTLDWDFLLARVEWKFLEATDLGVDV